MSEVSTYVSFSPGRPPVPGTPAIRSPGGGWRSCPRTARRRCRAAPTGLLAVSRRDPGLMLGYWRRPEETAAAFRGEWFVTGDRARMDARRRRSPTSAAPTT